MEGTPTNVIKQLSFMDDSHVEKLLMNQQDALLITYDGRSLLHHAILSGNLAVVGAILQRGGFSDEPDSEGQTPLLAACQRGQLWPVHQLLAAGADGSVRDASGAGCAHAAAAAGQLTVLQYLGEVVGFSLSDPDDDGRTPLMVAAAGGHAAAVKYLIEQARPSLLSADAGGRTALHLAAAAGHQHVCWLLVTSGSAELLTAADAEGRAPHQLPSVSRSPCGRMLSDLYRRQAAGRGPPSVRPAQLWSLLRPAVTYAAALAACSLGPDDWAPLLNPALMLTALITLRGQGHRLSHPSRAPSWFALGLVLTLLGASVACVLLYMQTHALVPLYVTGLSGVVLTAFVVTFHRAVTAAPGLLPPTDRLADTLRTAAATPTGQLSYCPHCQVVLAMPDRHCRLCARCVRDYDHHCLYIINCVAAANRRVYLRCLLAGTVGCLTFLGHAWAYLVRTEPVVGRWPPRLAGCDIYMGTCVLGQAAALLLLRSLLSHELTYLWRALPGAGYRKLAQMARFVAGGTLAPARRDFMQC
ncbi:palmitoyltransferase AKR1-like isoform X1 [Amphibalanus amphitrite]|nr:palmitoyltransferase AKR1-like isoform X1 [Amphibalanus amphitrite]XP_043216783.1 palmitoyltransferase AKR1-like isoform X1 [Amphibalanus amphitrite]XP_043216784.1 palmitoyltransferase AKR1-like isoform X1 [Amphibalanus amphitrite]XP_043216785.1 palmitoyltransferase AKR1-like isoform X1 [Amphibalanus amphitrite]